MNRTLWKDTIVGTEVETEIANDGDVLVYRNDTLIGRLLPDTFKSVYSGFIAVPAKHHATSQADYDAYKHRVNQIIMEQPGLNHPRFVRVTLGRNELARDPNVAPLVLKFMAVRDGHWVGDYHTRAGAMLAAGLK